MSGVSLSERDEEILRCLTFKVRVFSAAQVARTWWAGTANAAANARARLNLLERAGLVVRFSALAHPELDLSSPVAVWEPGAEPPDFGAVSWALQSRWTGRPVLAPFVIATKLAAGSLGGCGGRYPRPSEQTHDLHMASVFLLFRRRHPGLIPHWVSEEVLRSEHPGAGRKVPDAMIRAGATGRVIEFGGSYSKPKLRDFHEWCAAMDFPYEVW